MDRSDADFEGRVIDIINKTKDPRPLQADPVILTGFANAPMPGPSTRSTRPMHPQADRREAQYEHCRRLLRVFPVKGGEVLAAFKDFMRTKMKLTDDFIDNLGHMTIVRHRDPRSKTGGEIIVTFETREARDAVKSESKNLAGDKDKAGIRLQIPGYLTTNFKLLENLGYQMRAVDPTVRRVVKFDDDAQDLMMDVKVGDDCCLLYTSPSPRDS